LPRVNYHYPVQNIQLDQQGWGVKLVCSCQQQAQIARHIQTGKHVTGHVNKRLCIRVLNIRKGIA
jgi:hypothetical protein